MHESQQKLVDAIVKFGNLSDKLEERYFELLAETTRLKEELAKKESMIKSSARLTALGEMAAAIAHEVRNPLGSIKLFLSLLKQDLKGQEAPSKIVGNIDRSISTLEGVVSNILLFSKNRNISMVPVNIHALIRETLIEWESYQKDGLEIELNLSGNPYINGSESSLRQILNNLLLNSAQAMSYKGKIRIECSDSKNEIKLSVVDNGPGISDEIGEDLFEPFATTKREGTGLGLAIVRQIVTQHKGNISVRNDHGARFDIVLPRVQGDESQGEKA